MSLEDYSDINLVNKMSKKLKLGDVYPSNRKNKKYMILNPNNGKFVHFGLLPYMDYTKHLDKVRREKFRNRNWRWAEAEPYTPAYLSYYLLW